MARSDKVGRTGPRPRDRPGGVHGQGADARLDEPRVARQDRGDRRSALLVALADAPVEKRRAVRKRADGARDPPRLRRGRGAAQGGAERRNRLPHRKAQLFFPEARQRARGDGGTGHQGPERKIRTMSAILERLADVVESRKAGDPEKSYVSRLFSRGPDAILKKVGEQATEAVNAAEDRDQDRHGRR